MPEVQEILGGGKKKTAKKAQSPWIKHLMAVKKAHPGKSLGDCMKIAAASYKKK
jgi:hypothetical protein